MPIWFWVAAESNEPLAGGSQGTWRAAWIIVVQDAGTPPRPECWGARSKLFIRCQNPNVVDITALTNGLLFGGGPRPNTVVWLPPAKWYVAELPISDLVV
jgi:hypothetical protein